LRFGKSLAEAFYRSYKKNPDANVFYSKVAGEWRPVKFEQSFQYLLKTIAGLRAVGFRKGQIASIIGENRYEWMLSDYAVQWMGGAVAAIYTTSSPDQIQYILNESEATILFVSNRDCLSRLAKIRDLSHLKTIVAWDSIDHPVVPPGVRFMTREEFLSGSITEAEAEAMLKELDPNSMSVLLYTSGTTGEPKGVVLRHSNFIANLEMFYKAIPLEPPMVTVSFLPLSHIYERVVLAYLLVSGVQIYFAESIDKLIDNFAEAKPHVNSCVPRIFEKIYAKVMDKIKSASPLRKKLFFAAMWVGHKTAYYRQTNRKLPPHWLILYFLSDALVFRKIKAITGGRARIFISGGAPLSREIAEFFFGLGFVILEGYGLSETCILSVNRPENIRFGTVGLPFEGVELKFDSDGEILARGPTVMKGYYKRDDATTEVIDADGWFHTGDIGQYDEVGYIKITDRKKDLIVSAAGKKIAPQPIENLLKADSLIEFACLVGDKRNFVSCLITPNVEFCRSWAASKGFALATAKQCAEDLRLRERYQRLVDEVNATLPRYATIKEFRVLPHSFTIESGELTPTLKLKRRVIQEKYRLVIDSMYPLTAEVEAV
jgi:long-chain acyl-CoA synthetase